MNSSLYVESAPERRDERNGLTSAQAASRKEKGLVNVDGTVRTKSVRQIIRGNVCTLFNLVIAVLGLAVFLVGSYKNLLFMGVMLCNLVIGIVQELRAKLVIDRLSFLTASRVCVVRDGEKIELPMEEVVLDDIIIFSRGSQVVADCVILEGECEANESLLTGESNAVYKRPGDTLLSGSFLINGVSRVKAVHVGADTYVSTISNEAKKPKPINSEIMRSLRKFIRYVSIAIFPLGALLFQSQYFQAGGNLKSAVVSTAAALIGMIPGGLVLLTSVVLTVSVMRLSKQKVMVQELYCIETLARVDVICLDKTGTLTEGSMELDQVLPVNGFGNEEAERALRGLCAAMQDETATFQAIFKKYGGKRTETPSQIISFSSEKKWSGVTFAEKGSLILGAPEFILQNHMDVSIKSKAARMAKKGRVLLLAYSAEPFCDRQLPTGLEALALLLVQDTIRTAAAETLGFFMEQGVALKVISGDNPVTVSTIARRIGLAGAERYLDASALDENCDMETIVGQYTVFGRVSPQQKKEMVAALQKQGHTVAMTGDGVNDVLALKEADCSIAMASGSDAARNVSHMVLLESDFAALPGIVYEGRRSINNLQRSAALFLVKTIFSIGLTLAFLFLSKPYIFQPIHLTLISCLTIGLPSFVLALEPNKNRIQGDFFKNVLRQALPGGLTVIFNVAALVLLERFLGLDKTEVSTLCLLLVSFTGILVIIRLCVPFTPLRKILLAVITAGLILAIAAFPAAFSLAYLETLHMLYSAVSFISCFFLYRLLCYLTDRKSSS